MTYLNDFKKWVKKHWKWVTGVATFILIYLFGFLKGNSKTKDLEKRLDMEKSDFESIKKTKDEIIRGIEEKVISTNEEQKRLEKEKLSRIESAEKSAKTERKDLENNSDKLDKILQDKHGLTKI